MMTRESEFYRQQQIPCPDCPFRKNGHIKVENVEELANFFANLNGLMVNHCHSVSFGYSCVECKGAILYRENLTGAEHLEIFKAPQEMIYSHEQSNKPPFRATMKLNKGLFG